MIIRRMTASFGALNNSELTLKPGMNIINAPNEWGKSTWSAFISAMLYGIDTGSRARAGYLPDKTRYRPWSGAVMEGTMELEWCGERITLRRTSGRGSAPMQDFYAAFTGSGEPVPGLSGASAGETLCGVPKSVFMRSAFIAQAALGVDRAPELEKRILAMVSSGEEDSSYTEADERLRAWLRKRRHNRYGAIPAAEAELEAARARLGSVSEAANQLTRLREEAERAEKRVLAIKRDVEQSRKRQHGETLRLLSESRQGLSLMERDADEKRERAARDAAAAEGGAFCGDPDSLRERVEGDAAAAREYERGTKVPKWPRNILICSALLAALTGIAYLLFQLPEYTVEAVRALGILGAATALRYVFFLTGAKKAKRRQSELLSGYGVSSSAELIEAFERHITLWNRKEASSLELAEAINRLEEARASQKKLNAELLSGLDFVNGNADADRLGRELAMAEGECRSLRESAARTEGRLKSLGDPVVLEAEAASLQARLDELKEQYAALELAVGTLREANSELQSRFAPLLGKRAGEIMERLTGGRYESLAFDREFSAEAKLSGQSVSHGALHLSRGSADQLYLALRLAICELVLPERELCPIVLDDALASFDDSRCKLALRLLMEMSEKRQVILFTCHSRESALLS